MIDDGPKPSPADRRRLVDIVRDETAWEPRDELSDRERQLRRLADGRTAELFFTVPDTNGQIQLLIDGRDVESAGEVRLDIPLAGGFDPPNPGGFAARLITAHEAIAAEHAAGYVSPVAGSSLVGRARIPAEWDRRTVELTIYSFDSIAENVEILHDELVWTLDSHTP